MMIEATKEIIVAMINNSRLTSVDDVKNAIKEILKTFNDSDWFSRIRYSRYLSFYLNNIFNSSIAISSCPTLSF